ncbi:MAG TPA: hypothetical protein VNK26_00150 [Pyrinomonadaceae bacterium]|nr:hypothetical protein [Pyrinomonadaceae bacterium]
MAESSQQFIDFASRGTFRLVSVEQIAEPLSLRFVYYSYIAEQALVVEGDFTSRAKISYHTEDFDPLASDEEIALARQIALSKYQNSSNNPTDSAKFISYDPMPTVSNYNGERLVNMGIRNLATGENKIVGVSLKSLKVIEYENNAPPSARATSDSCGLPNANQPGTARGLAGTLNLNAFEEGSSQPVWEMTVIRPSASTGGEGSGIEIRNVKYRGKSVLKRAHLPVLNVQYVSDCGPFRDFQFSEGYFQIPASGVSFPNGSSGGFAIIDSPGVATTIIETRNDTGNFQGVAVYQQTVNGVNEMVLVTEMEAGWYRYSMEWRFGFDGRIRPRFGFGSVGPNSCICITRTHHAYWRFDFDVVNPQNNVFISERGKRFLKPIKTETMLLRSLARTTSIVVQNALGNEAYWILPGKNDGSVRGPDGSIADVFGVGDIWILRFKGTPDVPSEIDDPNTTPVISINPWLSGESLTGQDVVIWYGAHQKRSDDTSLYESNQSISGMHVIGPDLYPVAW